MGQIFRQVGRVISVGVFLVGLVAAAPQPHLATQDVDGLYRLSGLDAVAEGRFLVRFEACGHGSPVRLRLEADHVHQGLRLGDQYQVRGRVQRGDCRAKDGCTAHELLVMIPRLGSAPAPVWLISVQAKARGLSFKGVRFLHMHDPAMDYTIF